MTPQLKTYAWAYAEERFGRNIVRLSFEPMGDGQPLVLKAEAEKQIAAALSQADAYRVDAERYRLWRDKFCLAMHQGEEIDPVLLALADAWTPDDCDSILDAARKPAEVKP